MKKLLYLLLFVCSFATAQTKQVLGPKGFLTTIGVDYSFKPLAYTSNITLSHNPQQPNRRIVLTGPVTINFTSVDSSSYGEVWLFRGNGGEETITLLPAGKQKGTFPVGSNEEVHIRYFKVYTNGAYQMKYEIL